MLTHRKIVLTSLAVVGALLLLSVSDFLALHDIKKEYVSTEVLSSLELDLAGSLPYWTVTSGEWSMVTISFIARVGLLMGNTLLLFLLLRSETQQSPP